MLTEVVKRLQKQTKTTKSSFPSWSFVPNSNTIMTWTANFAQRAQHMKRSAVRELLKLTAQPDIISFAGGLPAAELFPIQEVKEATEAVLARVGPAALQYGETEGLGELRDWIASRFARPGLPITRHNVVIVTGAQQALDLIGRIYLDEEDTVIVENPTYLALLSAWRPLGVRFLAGASDQEGMRVEELEPLLEHKPKLIYTIPNFQNPQGTTLRLDRRHRLIELVRARNVAVVEDNPYGELRFEGGPLPHLFELAARMDSNGAMESHLFQKDLLTAHEPTGIPLTRPADTLSPTGGEGWGKGDRFMESNVLYVGTFSKVLMPGLRVGWVIAPEPVIDKIVQAKQAVDLHTSTLCQWIMWELIRGGVLDRQLPRLRQAYRERRDAMLSALKKYFPDKVTWTRPEGGMFLLATLPEGLNANEVLAEAILRKVAFVPGGEFHLHGAGQNTFRLNFSSSPPPLIEEGVKRLGCVLKGFLAP